jgi:hypothetical protein
MRANPARAGGAEEIRLHLQFAASVATRAARFDQHTPPLNRVSIKFARHVIHPTVRWVAYRIGKASLRVALVTRMRAPCRTGISGTRTCRGSNTTTARDTRLRLEYTERLLAKRDAAEGFRYLRLLLLLLGISRAAAERAAEARHRRTTGYHVKSGRRGLSPFS